MTEFSCQDVIWQNERTEIGVAMNESGRSLAIGIRAYPRGIQYAVVSGTMEEPVLEDCQPREMPTAFSFAKGLEFVFNEVTDILGHFDVRSAAMREAEYTRFATDSPSRMRNRVEGAAIAACAQRGIDVKIVVWKTIASVLQLEKKIKRDAFMKASHLRKLDWSALSPEQRDAIAAGVAVLG